MLNMNAHHLTGCSGSHQVPLPPLQKTNKTVSITPANNTIHSIPLRSTGILRSPARTRMWCCGPHRSR